MEIFEFWGLAISARMFDGATNGPAPEGFTNSTMGEKE
jgi:hypothetical protein